MGWMLELAVSRQREFLADASAAEMTRYPEGLVSALRKISGDTDDLQSANRATQQMYIVNPLKLLKERKRLDEHPPERRRENQCVDGVSALLQRTEKFRQKALRAHPF